MSTPTESSSSLTAIHVGVIQNLKSLSSSSIQQERLVTVKRRRIGLAATLAARRASAFETLATTLQKKKKTAYESNGTARNELVDKQAAPSSSSSLADSMQSIRHSLKLAAAYRLAGISLLDNSNDDEEDELLTLRLDICVDGTYVATHAVFFQALVDDDDNDTYLQLCKHNLPLPAKFVTCPLLHIGRKWKMIPQMVASLRHTVGRLYQACYIHYVRKQELAQLQEEKNTEYKMDGLVVVQNDSSSRVEFTVRFTSMVMQIELEYEDALQALPTRVQVQNATPRQRTSNPVAAAADVVSEDEEDEENEIVQAAKSALLRASLPCAIQEIASAIVKSGQWV